MAQERQEAMARRVDAGPFVRRFRTKILAEWKLALRGLPAATQLRGAALVDHVPVLLDQIADLAEAIAHGQPLDEPLAVARQHVNDRLSNGFDISAMVEELSMLRGCALNVWAHENAGGDVLELRALDLAIDKAIEVSVARYEEARERIRDERERTLAKLESLLAASPVGIAFVDRDLRYLRINDALASINGQPAAAHLGRTVGEILPAVADKLKGLLRNVLETGQPRMNVPFVHPSGRALRSNYFPVRDRQGVIRGVGAIVLDETDEKRTQEALRVEQARLQSLLEHTPAAIWLKDADGRIVLANQRLAEFLGHTFADVIGHTSEELLSPPEAAQHREHDVKVMREQRALEVEETVHGPDGLRTFLSIKFPIPTDPPLVGGIATEITERKKIEDELRIAIRIREDVLAIVSHDLRNPLSAIELSVSTLQGHHEPDHRMRRHLELIHRSAVRMEALIDDLLDTANIRAGRLVLDTRRETIGSVVTEALELQRLAAEEKGISIEQHCEVPDLEIECDRDRMLQVFGNLIGNAIKFCRSGDAVVVTGMRDGDNVRFSVKDDGPGIARELQPFLFDAYWSGTEHMKRGSGLGLYISRGIIEGHGGRIWVESEPGDGSCFLFTIPIAR